MNDPELEMTRNWQLHCTISCQCIVMSFFVYNSMSRQNDYNTLTINGPQRALVARQYSEYLLTEITFANAL